jgi:hypothetical protein
LTWKTAGTEHHENLCRKYIKNVNGKQKKEEVCLFIHSWNDRLESPASQKTTVIGMTHEESAIRFEGQSHASGLVFMSE